MAGKTPADLRQDLDELRRLASDLAVAEDRLTRHAETMRREEAWAGLDEMRGAVYGAVSYALAAVLDDSTSSGLQVAQEAQDALDVVDLALSRGEAVTA